MRSYPLKYFLWKSQSVVLVHLFSGSSKNKIHRKNKYLAEKMSIPFSGVFTRSGGVIAAIAKQIKLLNFKGVRRITVKFDPFHEKATPTRLVYFQ